MDIIGNNKPTAIDVNIKLPNEPEETISLGDIIRFLRGGRKILLITTIIGLTIGLISAGIYYIDNIPELNGGIVTATIRYLYPRAVDNLAPNGSALDHSILLSSSIIDPVVAALPDIGISESILRSNLSFENGEEAATLKLSLLLDNDQIINNIDGIAILSALIQAYESWFNETFILNSEIEKDIRNATKEWDSYFLPAINWETMEVSKCFAEIHDRVNLLVSDLYELQTVNLPFLEYGISRTVLINELNTILREEISYWIDETSRIPYISDEERFILGASDRIDSLEQEKANNNALIEQYINSIPSFGDGYTVNIDVNMDTDLGILLNTINQCDMQINRINQALEFINNGTNVRNIEAAENAFLDIISKLDTIHESGRVLIMAMNEELTSESVGFDGEDLLVVLVEPSYVELFTEEASMAQIAMFIVGFTTAGFLVGLIIVAGKKHTQEHLAIAAS